MVPLLPTHFSSQVYGGSRKLGADSKGEMWHCPISAVSLGLRGVIGVSRSSCSLMFCSYYL